MFFAATIILVVFMPLFSFEGVEAKLFQPMAISIILAVISAIFVALIIVPALTSYLVYRSNHVAPQLDTQTLGCALSKNITPGPSAYQSGGSHGAYTRCWRCCHPRAVGNRICSELEEGTINLRVTLAPSSSLETALAVVPKLEAKLLSFPEGHVRPKPYRSGRNWGRPRAGQ